MISLALAGNPNCGKTTLFNVLTGSNQYVGNWPGVTVDKKEGSFQLDGKEIRVVDLPGIYSLSPHTVEQKLARDFLIEEKLDLIVNIVDAGNLERNLYLTYQVLELGIPTIIVLNMFDELEASGSTVDVALMEKRLGAMVVPMCASKRKGVKEFLKRLHTIVHHPEQAIKPFFPAYDRNLMALLGQSGLDLPYWKVLSLLEGETEAEEVGQFVETKNNELAELSTEEREKLDALAGRVRRQFGEDAEVAVPDLRYKNISALVKQVLRSGGRNINARTESIDKVLTHKIFALPIFLLIMMAIFLITFGPIGSFLSGGVEYLFGEVITPFVDGLLVDAGAATWLQSLIVGGILSGLSSVLVFLPQITLLFLCLSIMEDSGYMARAAFITDRIMRKFGLGGKSFIPMLMGFGCTVPALMACRTLESEKERRLTMVITPFMSCGARLPVYAMMAGAFFAKNQGLVIFAIYLLGVVIAGLSGVLLNKTVLKGESSPFVMELPPYRLPTLRNLVLHVWDKVKGFLVKAGTVVFLVAVFLWFAQSFDIHLAMTDDISTSILAKMGNWIAPIFTPLGFGKPIPSVALVTGFFAKEAVVVTTGILTGAAGDAQLGTALGGLFTPLSAFSFMAFVLLYIPCAASMVTLAKEMRSTKWTLFAVGYGLVTAYLVALIIFQGGRLLGFA